MPYRQQELPAVVREVLFDDLLPQTQARLTEACREPERLLLGERREPFPRAVHGLLLSAAAGLGVAAALGWGYASLSFRDLVERNVQQAVLSGLLGLCVLGGAMALRAQRRAAGRLLRPGLYLFGRELVDARRRRLRLLSTEALVSVEGSGERLSLSFRDGSRHVFRQPGALAEVLPRQIEAARQQAEQAEERGAEGTPSALDPFVLERARWAEAPLPAAWRRRLRHLGLAALVAPASAALLCAAGRGCAVEQAARDERFEELAWFSVTDRWMAGWADQRWHRAALASQRVDSLELYAQISPHRRQLEQQLAERLAPCSGPQRLACVQAMRGLCNTPSPPVSLMHGVFAHLDARSMRQVMPGCQVFFRRNSWSERSFLNAQIDHAIAQRDARSLWDFGAHDICKDLYEQERRAIEPATSPTARVVALALARLQGRNEDLALRVETGGASYSSSAEALAYRRWRHEAAELLRKELQERSFGGLLRLDVPDEEHPSADKPRSGNLTLVADLELKPASKMPHKLSLQSVTWTLRWQPVVKPEPGSSILPALDLDEPSQTSFAATLTRPRAVTHPARGLPEASELRLLDELL